MDKIKLCINGDREITDIKVLYAALEDYDITPDKVSELVSGGARGADKLGEQWAKANKIKVTVFEANWDDLTSPNCKVKTNNYGKDYNANAGFERNQKMAEYADAILCLQSNGTTSGSDDCVTKFKKLNKPTYVFTGKKRADKYQF